jgi:hypothetical protein
MWLDFANLYYPNNSHFDIPVDLNIDPVETNHEELPSDISGLAFDNPVIINRFKILLDSIFKHIPDLQLSSLVIGSEIDAYLGTDSGKWGQYITFYAAVSAYARTLRPGLKVSCEAQFAGLTTNASDYLQKLNQYSDIIGVSYYPLYGDFTVKQPVSVASDFDNIVNQYPSKPIFFYQAGYPSAQLCNSSETLQAEFIRQVFQNWDAHSDNIKMIDFTWLHDWSEEAVKTWASYYGLNDSVFLAFIGSIGLRYWDGNGCDKASFKELQCQAKQRGYNNLNIDCSTGIAEQDNNIDGITIFPNPSCGKINVNIPEKARHLQIINSVGEIIKSFEINGEEKITAVIAANGIYTIIISADRQILAKKFVVIQ